MKIREMGQRVLWVINQFYLLLESVPVVRSYIAFVDKQRMKIRKEWSELKREIREFKAQYRRRRSS